MTQNMSIVYHPGLNELNGLKVIVKLWTEHKRQISNFEIIITNYINHFVI